MARILVIDDEAPVRTLIRRTLQGAGHEVFEAADGADGMRVAHEVPGLDLVITDVLMPNMDGIETISQLLEERPGARVIAMSGGGAIQDVEYLSIAERMGAVATLAKPFTPKLLIEAVDATLAD